MLISVVFRRKTKSVVQLVIRVLEIPIKTKAAVRPPSSDTLKSSKSVKEQNG
jgi:hypothetical protein